MKRRLLFPLLLVVFSLVAIELISFLALSIDGGSVYSPTAIDRARRQLRGEPAEGVRDSRATFGGAGEGSPEVLHPFLGYVRQPTEEPDPWGRLVTPQGFLLQGDRPRGDRPGDFVVGIFGGSVANILANSQAGVYLAERLAADPGFARRHPGRRVVVRSFAMGGYKQPQQLAALGYLAAIGTPLDLVINVDGFNDVVLPRTDNLPQGVNPFYPRRWDQRVSDLTAPETLSTIGEIRFLQARRAERAGLCDPVLRYSPTCEVVRRLLDRGLQARIATLREDLDSRSFRGFLAHGPPYEPGSPEKLAADLVAVWARSSRRMNDLAAGLGIPYFHFLQPNQYVPGSKTLHREERRNAYRPDSPYRAIVEADYPRLVAAGAALAEEGVAFHDLTRLFAGTRAPVYNDDCCHMNLRGNRMMADEIARRVLADLQP